MSDPRVTAETWREQAEARAAALAASRKLEELLRLALVDIAAMGAGEASERARRALDEWAERHPSRDAG